MKTQMQSAREGIFTPQMQEVAKKEGISEDRLLALMAEGKVIIPANIKHKALVPNGIGEGLRTKVNVNLGISNDCVDYQEEMQRWI